MNVVVEDPDILRTICKLSGSIAVWERHGQDSASTWVQGQQVDRARTFRAFGDERVLFLQVRVHMEEYWRE